MFGSHFITKTMIMLFSIPLISNADINIDLKPLQQMISGYEAAPIDTEQVKLAVQTLAATAQINAGVSQANASTGQASFQTANAAPQDAQFVMVMQNLQKLTEQAK